MVDNIINKLNEFRKEPKAFEKELQNYGKALRRVKKNDIADEIEGFAKGLSDIESLSPLSYSKGLAAACADELNHFLKSRGSAYHKSYADIKFFVDKHTKHVQKFSFILDDGPIDSLISRVFVSEFDKDRSNMKSLPSEEFKFIGVATKEINSEYVSVIIISDFVEEIEEGDYHFNINDFSELRKAFDTFDIFKTGKIDPKELKSNLRAAGLDLNNPALYEIIESLDTPDNALGVDFQKFCIIFDKTLSNDNNKHGLEKIFHLFISDPNQFIINEASIRKLCRSADITLNEDEAKEILERASLAGNELSFEEFYDIMIGYHNREDQ